MDTSDLSFFCIPVTMYTSKSPLTYLPPLNQETRTLQANITDDADGIPRPFTPLQEVFIITMLSAIITFTICGNCLVILSVCLDRKLRKTPNILIINLAVADLCVALLVMPFATAYQITGRWIFGKELCNLYVSFDMLCCTASITNLCVISLDRYLVITRPLRYANKRTPKCMLFLVAIVWFTAILISTSPLFIGGAVVEGNVCLVNQDYTFTIFSTFGAFYLPLIVMITLYFQIFRAAKKSRKADLRMRRGSPGLMLRRGSPDSANGKSSNGSTNESNVSMIKRDSNATEESGYTTEGDINPRGYQRRLTAIITRGRASLASLGSARRLLLSREPKAIRTLGVIVGCFTLCWLPFFILALYRPYCNCSISPTLESVFLWLGYINSTLNPIIYPLFNKNFMPAYRKMLLCKCKLREHMEYDDTYWRNERRRSSLGIGFDKGSDYSGPFLKHNIRRQSSVQFDDVPQIRKYSLKMDLVNCNAISNLPPIPSLEKEDDNEDGQ